MTTILRKKLPLRCAINRLHRGQCHNCTNNKTALYERWHLSYQWLQAMLIARLTTWWDSIMLDQQGNTREKLGDTVLIFWIGFHPSLLFWTNLIICRTDRIGGTNIFIVYTVLLWCSSLPSSYIYCPSMLSFLCGIGLPISLPNICAFSRAGRHKAFYGVFADLIFCTKSMDDRNG